MSEQHHQGDPCIYCGTPHDEVEPGPCTGAPSAWRFRKLVGSFKAVPGAWSGDAYCYHPHGVIRRGIIFTDHHNVNCYVSASVILEPDSGIIPADNGRAASISGGSGSAVPRPKSGGVLTIYRDGNWVGEDGPWRKVVIEVLADLSKEIADIEQREHEEKATAAAAQEAERAALFDKARSVIAKVEPCPTCDGLTYVKVDGEERACPDCQPVMAAEDTRDRAAGF